MREKKKLFALASMEVCNVFSVGRWEKNISSLKQHLTRATRQFLMPLDQGYPG